MQHDLTSYVNLTSSACTACFIGPNVCQADILNHLPQVSEVSDSQSYAAYFETTWMDGCIREDKRDCHDCAIKMWKLSDKRLLFWWGACGRYDDVAVMIIRDNEAELRCWQLTWKSRRFVEEPGANPAVDRLNNQLKQGWLNLCLTISRVQPLKPFISCYKWILYLKKMMWLGEQVRCVHFKRFLLLAINKDPEIL